MFDFLMSVHNIVHAIQPWLQLVILLLVVMQYQAIQAMRPTKKRGSTSFAVMLLVNEKSEVLLFLRKGDVFGSGLYGLPGGKVEDGETAINGAHREVLEEVGVVVDDSRLVHVVDRQGTETQFYLLVFKAYSWSGTPSNKEPHKYDAMGWFPLDRLPENIIPAHAQAIKNVLVNVPYSTHGWDVE